MERITQSYCEFLKPVILYREDVEELFHLMQEVSLSVEISTKDARWADLKELWENKTDCFTDLSFVTRNPHVSLNLKSDSVSIYISEDNLPSRGAFEKIRTFLTRKTRFYLRACLKTH